MSNSGGNSAATGASGPGPSTSKGGQEAIMDHINSEVNNRMEQAIEDLREKYQDMTTEEAQAQEDTKPTGSAYGNQNNKENEHNYTSATQGGQAEEDELDVLRAHRLAELKAKMDQKKKDRQVGYGTYREVTEEDFLKEVTTAPTVICHFYHREFAKCAIMDKHLAILAQQYPQIKFIKLNAEKAPFIVARLQVKTLPTVIRFRDGIADNKERLIGFEGLGGVEDFPTKNLAEYFELTEEESDDPAEDDYERRDGATYQENLDAMRRKIIESQLAEEDINDE
eukprot:gb/GECG01015888.1/.p1 GENE.gb/GECG01015888.1/~~gb/GECG01015888.1/.p1  ORF type:complete len:282 (+),score=53.45 gb/GECG01015888.1/:1-846(+)